MTRGVRGLRKEAQGESAIFGGNLGLAILVVVVFLLPLVLRSRDYYVIVLILCAINVILAGSFRLIAVVLEGNIKEMMTNEVVRRAFLG
jgi:hypothetical protein